MYSAFDDAAGHTYTAAPSSDTRLLEAFHTLLNSDAPVLQEIIASGGISRSAVSTLKEKFDVVALSTPRTPMSQAYIPQLGTLKTLLV